MNEEIKKQVDGLPIFSTNEAIDYTIQANWVLMPDVIELVERLTKWNDMSELPDIGTVVLIKYRHSLSGCDMFETDIVILDHDGKRIPSMEIYEENVLIGWQNINQ